MLPKAESKTSGDRDGSPVTRYGAARGAAPHRSRRSIDGKPARAGGPAGIRRRKGNASGTRRRAGRLEMRGECSELGYEPYVEYEKYGRRDPAPPSPPAQKQKHGAKNQRSRLFLSAGELSWRSVQGAVEEAEQHAVVESLD
ncbi:hypothetical protein NL676_026077 [Syzygium grande]|nr:hypothetical protein NL676_026077 [Syzygium grande]